MKPIYYKRNSFVGLEKLDFEKLFLFLLKFKGILNFRGKKGNSLKRFDTIFFNIKRLKKISSINVIYYAVRNLVTFINRTKKKLSGRLVDVPQFATDNKQMSNIIDWVIKQQKLRSYVRGYNINFVSKAFVDASNNIGPVVEKKKQYIENTLRGARHSVQFFDTKYGFNRDFAYYPSVFGFYKIKKSGYLGLNKKLNYEFKKGSKYWIKIKN